MKIVFSTTVYLPHIGGIEIYIHEIAQYLIAQGHDVTVIVADKYSDACVIEKIDGERILRLPAREVGGFFFLKKRSNLRLVCDEIRDASVVHVNVSKFLFGYFAKYKKIFNYKLVVTSHGWLYHTNKYKIIKDFYFKHTIAKNAPFYDGIINVSYQDQRIASSFGVTNSTVILNGVDCYKYSGLKRREKYEGHFLYWGRISPNKGIYECLRKLSEYNGDFLFRIVGKCEDPAYKEKLNSFITSSGMDDKVCFLGQLEDQDIKDLLDDTDVILMPSLHEGFGMTLVECLLSGRAIIANTIDSYEYILRCTNAEEFLFDYGSSNSHIESKINELIKEPIQPINVEQFSAENMIIKTLGVYGI